MSLTVSKLSTCTCQAALSPNHTGTACKIKYDIMYSMFLKCVALTDMQSFDIALSNENIILRQKRYARYLKIND